MAETLDPYLAQMKKEHPELDNDPNFKSVLLIDIWPVHIAKTSPSDFLNWMQSTHPNIIILFVPGGCALLVFIHLIPIINFRC